jgi:hypothetical protein
MKECRENCAILIVGGWDFHAVAIILHYALELLTIYSVELVSFCFDSCRSFEVEFC